MHILVNRLKVVSAKFLTPTLKYDFSRKISKLKFSSKSGRVPNFYMLLVGVKRFDKRIKHTYYLRDRGKNSELLASVFPLPFLFEICMSPPLAEICMKLPIPFC